MKPILILQHLNTDGPGWLGTWLARRGLPVDVRNTQQGQPFPDDLRGHAALAILGGEMSANDAMPSLRQAEHLIRLAVQHGVPLLGHCLGGQLMARALGGRVKTAARPEIGWQRLRLQGDAAAWAPWFGPAEGGGVRPVAAPTVFQWHYESFEPPPGALLLAATGAGASLTPQAFALPGQPQALAMQFHVEADADKISFWLDECDPRSGFATGQARAVHSRVRIRRDTALHLAAQHALAHRIYGRWLGLALQP